MADISEWSPVDESNTAAPPNGWPEGQATNTVNNCARAMMGATRRWYDTVTAQLASLTSSLANYVPLAGGTMTGALSAPSYQLSGVGFAARSAELNHHYLYDADGIDPAVILGGAAAGFYNLYRAETHYLQSNTGAVTFATFNAAALSVAGHIGASGNLTITGNIDGNIINGNAVTSDGHITAIGNVTAANLISNGNLTTAGSATTAGDINCSAALYVHTLIDCTGNIDAGSYTRNGVPMVMLSQTQLDRIEARLALLENLAMREPA